MTYLLDTDICSAYLKGDGGIFNRVMQHSGRLSISAISAGELYSWVCRAKAGPGRLQGLVNLLSDVQLLPINHDVAQEFGKLRASLLDQGRPTPEIDLFIASTALLYELTLVTHNIKDFVHIPGLHVEDWLA